MDYLLLAALVVGVLLFFYSWLKIFFAGLGHHAITGLIAAIPLVNLLILPTIWHRAYSWFMLGLLGFIVAVGSWFIGADKPFFEQAELLGIDVRAIGIEPPERSEIEKRLEAEGEQEIVKDITTPAEPLAPRSDLPQHALYRMDFTAVDKHKLSSHQGRYLRVTRNDRKVFEGKLLNAGGDTLKIERRTSGGIIEHAITLTDIDKVEIMVRR